MTDNAKLKDIQRQIDNIAEGFSEQDADTLRLVIRNIKATLKKGSKDCVKDSQDYTKHIKVMAHYSGMFCNILDNVSSLRDAFEEHNKEEFRDISEGIGLKLVEWLDNTNMNRLYPIFKDLTYRRMDGTL